jgi:hypothetical protein
MDFDRVSCIRTLLAENMGDGRCCGRSEVRDWRHVELGRSG